MENQFHKKTENLSIKDITFFPPTNEQEGQVRSLAFKQYKNKAFRRFFWSIPVFIVILAGEVIARICAPTYSISGFYYLGKDSIPTTVMSICLLFVVFHCLSVLQLFLKYKMNQTADRYECLCGEITDKYDSRNMTVDAKKKVPNYLLFSCEQGHCTTALPVNDKKLYHTVKIGDPILVIRHNPIGNVSYSFLPLQK